MVCGCASAVPRKEKKNHGRHEGWGRGHKGEKDTGGDASEIGTKVVAPSWTGGGGGYCLKTIIEDEIKCSLWTERSNEISKGLFVQPNKEGY